MPRFRPNSVVLEVTRRCNHGCRYCYNIWKQPGGSSQRPEREPAALLEALLRDCDPLDITLSGGEPMLRDDLAELVAAIAARGIDVTVATNGSLLSEARACSLAEAGVTAFQVSLPTADPETHRKLTGAPSFDQVLDGLATLTQLGSHLVTVFVGTRLNIGHLEQVLKLSFALGAQGTLVNRFNAGGAGARQVAELMPTRAELCEMLATASRLSAELDYPVSTPIPMPPCVIDPACFPGLELLDCAAGTDDAYYALDLSGDVRPCNHSTTVLGNVFEEPFSEIVSPRRLRPFLLPVPARCEGCPHLETCRGGCRAAAEQCYGCLTRPDPIVELIGQPL